MNICMIPCRSGSERLPKKNYLELDGNNLVERMVTKALKAECFDKIVINSDDKFFQDISDKYSIDFFLREEKYANSKATSEMVVNNFLDNFDCENLFWLNTASPLSTIDDIKTSVSTFQDSDCNSLVSSFSLKNHAMFDNNPLNFKFNSPFLKTQDIEEISYFTYAVMGWNSTSFKKFRKEKFQGLFPGKVLILNLSKWTTFLLKNKEDLFICNSLLNVAPE